jgi:hypothetical protein
MQDLISKVSKVEGFGYVAQEVDHLPTKHKALNSNSSIAKIVGFSYRIILTPLEIKTS